MAKATVQVGRPSTELMVLVFTDVVGSVAMKNRLGTSAYAELLAHHDELFQSIVSSSRGGEVLKDLGDGFLARFTSTSEAVNAALRFQQALALQQWDPEPIRVRIGLHLGEMTERDKDIDGRPKLIGLVADLSARLMGLALPGQILMTRAAFDEARQYVREHPKTEASDESLELRWMAHGPYLFEGTDEPMEVCEVGAVGLAPLKPPPDRAKGRRAIQPGEEEMYGWRPAIARPIPRRDNWLLQSKIGEGGFGEVWLTQHRKTGTHRVFKFCYDADRLRSLKRELTLFRLLREALGDRPDIAKIHDIQLDKPPFYLESDFTEQGNLADWAQAQGGIDQVPLATRLNLLAGACNAVAAAHSIGILHKDLKPSNVLIYETEQGEPRPCLCDFGIGILTDRSQLERYDITLTGFTETVLGGNESSRTGTRIYAPPETLAGQPFTIQGDVFALGVLLYQMVAGDLTRPLGQGWESDIPDPLLRDDIARCVVGQPQERLSSASELAKRLRTLEPRRKARRRRNVTKLALAASVILAVLFTIASGLIVHERGLRRQITDQRDEAQRQTEIAQAEAKQRMLAEQLAEQERDDAIQAREEAQAAKAESDRQRDEAQRQSYVANIAGADAALRAHALRTAKRRLDQAPQHLRNWEWGYLSNLADRSLVTLFGHQRNCSIAFSPDGTRIVSGGSGNSVKLWDAATGEELATLRGHEVWINSVAFSPDGTRIASGSWKRIKLWDASTGEELATLGEDNRFIRSVVFSPDGTRIASGAHKNRIRILDASTGEELASLCGHDQRLYTVAFSPDGARLASGSADQTVKLWDASTGEELLTLRGHVRDVVSVAFSPDGARLASGSWDNTIKVWDTVTGEELATLSGHELGVGSVAFSSDGKRIASGSDDATIKIWDASTGEEIATVQGHDKWVDSVAFSPDGKRLASGSVGKIKLWDASTLADFTTLRGHESLVQSVAFSPDGRLIASGAYDNRIILWDVSTGEKLASLRGDDLVFAVVFSPDGTRLASGAWDHMVKLWDTFTGEELTRLRGHEHNVLSVAFSPDGTRIASGSRDNTIRVWDASTGEELHTLLGHEYDVWSVVFSPDGARLASGSADNTIKVWDASTGEELNTLRGHELRLCSVVFSPDGTRIASGAYDDIVSLWDVSTGEKLASLRGHEGPVWSVAFSPDGTRIVSGSMDRTIKVWDASTGEELTTLRGHDGHVMSVAFSPDGTRIASAGGDNTVRLWDRALRRDRLQQRLEATDAAAAAQPIVSRFFDEGLEPAEMASRLRAGKSLRDPVRHAALNLLLRRCDADRAKTWPLIDELFARYVFSQAVIGQIGQHPELTPPLRKVAVRLVTTRGDHPERLNGDSWLLVRYAGQEREGYLAGLRGAEAACQAEPENASYLNTLGVAQYRVGRYVQALETLTRSDEINAKAPAGSLPDDIAFLAMAHHQLAHVDEARASLARLREIMKNARYENNEQARAFLLEAEALIESE